MRIPEYQNNNLSKHVENLYYLSDDDSLILKCTSLDDEDILFKLTELDSNTVRVKVSPHSERGFTLKKDNNFLSQLKFLINFIMSDINRKYK